MAKQFSAYNWVPSKITQTQINGYVTTGALASKRVLNWRVLDSEFPPEPQDGEVIVFMQHLDRGFSPLDQNSSGMSSQASNSIHKILDRTPCPIYATFKYSAKSTFRKNHLWSCSGISSTWTIVRSSLTVPTQNWAVFRFRKENRLTSHMQNIIAILRIGTRHGFTARTLPLMEKILCQVTVPTGLAITTHYLHAYPPQNEELLLLKSPRYGPSWPTV